MGMTRDAVFIHADKHSIVILRILKHQLLSGELRQHLPADTALLDEIGKHPAHIGMHWRENKGLALFRFSAFAVLPVFHTLLAAQQKADRIRKRQVVESFHKVNGIVASFRRMIVPVVSTNSNAVVTVQPFISAGGQELFTLPLEKVYQVHRIGSLLLLVCKIGVGLHLGNAPQLTVPFLYRGMDAVYFLSEIVIKVNSEATLALIGQLFSFNKIKDFILVF